MNLLRIIYIQQLTVNLKNGISASSGYRNFRGRASGTGLEGLAGAGLAGVELYDIEDAIVVPSGSIVLMHSFGSL